MSAIVNIPSLAEGWHDLAGGGAVEIRGGIPVCVTDKGDWDLDEQQLFAEAIAVTGMRLTWTATRAWRWRRHRLRSLLRRDRRGRWCYAELLRGACDVCGVEVGERWMKEHGGDGLSWVGEDCARDSTEVER